MISDPSELHELLAELVAIGAPTGREEKRADFIENWLQKNTLASIGRDSIGNVWADLSDGAGAVHLFDAHIDTVFELETIELERDGAIWRAPGLIDNGAAVAILMLWVKAQARCEEKSPFLVSFSVGEENEGNLRGIKAIAERFGPRLRDAIVLDLRLDSACRQNVGSLRYELEWRAPGGHSWGDFGFPSAIHAMSEWIAALPGAFAWQNGRHSFNVGEIMGGQGATAIAPSAKLKLDVRSIEARFLRDFGAWMSAQLQTSREGLQIHQLALLERPAAFIEADHPLVSLVERAHAELELPLKWDIFSTNANALGARGIPAVTTGLSRGGGIHTPNEYLEVVSLEAGARKLARLAARLGAL